MHPPRPLCLALVLLLAACGDSADEAADAPAASDPAAFPGAVAADADHYSTVYENAAVRILEVAYGPGESSVMHRHPPHCWILVTESEWDMANPDGTEEPSSLEAGSFGCAEAESAHRPTNTGDDTSRLFLVEMREGATAGTDTTEGLDAVEADPAHYGVEYENDAIRILRIAYGPGEGSVEHGHPANCIVWLQVDESSEDGPAVGDFSCSDAGVHSPRGSAGGAVEVMAIEFKGRASAQ